MYLRYSVALLQRCHRSPYPRLCLHSRHAIPTFCQFPRARFQVGVRCSGCIHNACDTRGLSDRESFALSQHVRVIVYYIIYNRFLAVALPDRPNYVQFLTWRLMLAHEDKCEINELTEVCFDRRARHAHASADPKPSRSLSNDVKMNPPRDGNDKLDLLLTLSNLALGQFHSGHRWLEIESVRPSSEFLCKAENFPRVNLGDVNPDRLTDAVILISDRDRMAMEREGPDRTRP